MNRVPGRGKYKSAGLQMERAVDQGEEVRAVGGEGGGGDFPGKRGDDFGVDHAILSAGKPLGVGAD